MTYRNCDIVPYLNGYGWAHNDYFDYAPDTGTSWSGIANTEQGCVEDINDYYLEDRLDTIKYEARVQKIDPYEYYKHEVANNPRFVAWLIDDENIEDWGTNIGGWQVIELDRLEQELIEGAVRKIQEHIKALAEGLNIQDPILKEAAIKAFEKWI